MAKHDTTVPPILHVVYTKSTGAGFTKWTSSYPLDSRGRRGSISAYGRRRHRAVDGMCPPLLGGRYPTSSLIWGHPTSHRPSGFLPVCRLCHPTPFLGGVHGISRVPDSALVTCHGLRPRWVRWSQGRCGSFDVAFRVTKHVGTHSSFSHHGAQSLHACALRPITSLCTLRRPRYR
jgi:hypothetical protein